MRIARTSLLLSAHQFRHGRLWATIGALGFSLCRSAVRLYQSIYAISVYLVWIKSASNETGFFLRDYPISEPFILVNLGPFSFSKCCVFTGSLCLLTPETRLNRPPQALAVDTAPSQRLSAGVRPCGVCPSDSSQFSMAYSRSECSLAI